ncbi:Nucleus accumbens-associated protein 2 [Larimichthys crocea]|uniref:Nucleus accumbens-associated protein 2 n=1 Tax=Larimichthys crocea TaxID=215358 RepID=A0A6G0J657_LARCR|nr:Nucleus accumbens-associated protein 2 [Larimichthys crocea]
MAGDCTHTNASYAKAETFYPSKPWSAGDDGDGGGACGGGDGEVESEIISKGCGGQRAPNFEMIGGLLYRKKLERGFINYREVLDEDRRHEAIATFHRRRRPGQRHLSLEETYKCVAENYWWEGMYFQIRDFVLDCPECQRIKKTEEPGGRGCVTKTMASHGADMLSKLRSQREAGMFCDITLRTNGRPYLAHRAVLAAVSDHFQEIFTEMDSSMKADIDLTGFSEDSLLSLLDFSYSSTLCVRQKDLPEVIAMARHLGMWHAVDACSALMREQEQQLHPGKGFAASACAGACHRQQMGGKRKRVLGLDNMNSSFSLMLDASDESLEESPRRNLRRMPKSQSHTGLPLSPSHRMKLMDFKSPSSKKAATPRHAIATPQSRSYPPMSPSNTRLLRSTPGAAKEVQRLLPKLETPRRNKKPHAIAQLSSASRLRPSAVCSPVRVKQEVEEVGEDEQDYARAQEKYKLMNVLGLQRTALLPRPEDLIGWRQKKRLRKLKANNYSLTKRRKPRSTSPALPFGDVTLSLPLCIPVNTRLLNKSVKTKPVSPVSTERMTKRPKTVPPSDRSMRSKGVLSDMFLPSFGGRELRRSVRKGLSLPSNNCCGHKSLPSQRTQGRNKVTVETVKALRYNSGRPATKGKLRRGSAKEVEKAKCKPREDGRKVGSQGLRGVMDMSPRVNEPGGLQFSEQAPPPSIYNHPLYKVIKEEPADPVAIVTPFSDPPSPDLGKRQSKPPIKLLDSGFLFSFCRPAGGPMAVLKKEEESVDICLTRSVSQVGEKFGAEESSPHRALRARVPPAMPVLKRERLERSVSQSKVQRPKPNSRNNKSAEPRAPRTMPKQQVKLPLSGKSCAMLDAVRRARLKQLRGPRSQAPKGPPKASHACLQCPASYKDCDALIMHRLRHIEGKHWPCPLCSKTFFRLRNLGGVPLKQRDRMKAVGVRHQRSRLKPEAHDRSAACT